MTTKLKKKSRLLEAIHETAHDFYDSGTFNQEQMQKYDALCLSPVSTEAAKTPIYLDDDIIEYLNEKCLTKQESLQLLVNDLLRKDIEIAKRVAL
jgi:putative transcriptional regulator